MTPFRSYKPYTPLAGEPLQPLGQLSGPAGPAITGPEQDAKNTGSFGVRQIFLRSGGLRAEFCVFAALDALVDFLAMNGHVLRRRDTDAHLVALDAEHGPGHRVSDHQGFADAAGADQHLSVPISPVRAGGPARPTSEQRRVGKG